MRVFVSGTILVTPVAPVRQVAQSSLMSSTQARAAQQQLCGRVLSPARRRSKTVGAGARRAATRRWHLAGARSARPRTALQKYLAQESPSSVCKGCQGGALLLRADDLVGEPARSLTFPGRAADWPQLTAARRRTPDQQQCSALRCAGNAHAAGTRAPSQGFASLQMSQYASLGKDRDIFMAAAPETKHGHTAFHCS